MIHQKAMSMELVYSSVTVEHLGEEQGRDAEVDPERERRRYSARNVRRCRCAPGCCRYA